MPEWSSSRAVRIGVPIGALAVLLATVFVAMRFGPGTNAGGGELLRVSMTGERVQEDDALTGYLSGDQRVSDDLATTAFCNNGADFASNVTLDLSIIVATRPELVRVAEIVSAGEFDIEVVRRVEEHAIRSRLTTAELDDWVNSWADPAAPEASRYLIERSQPATAGAGDHLVVYAASRSVSDQTLVFADADLVNAGRVRNFVGGFGFGVSRVDVPIAGDRAVALDPRHDCARALGFEDENWWSGAWPVSFVALGVLGGLAIFTSARRSRA